MSHDINRTTEYKYTVEGQLSELIVRNYVTGDQVTKWHYGTTLADSGIASKSLLRAKVYPDSDDPGSGDDGNDETYDRVELCYNRQREMASVLDQNGTEHRFEYDGLGRLVHDRVTALGTGIDGAVRRLSRQYDRTGRLQSVSSWSDAEAGQGCAVNEVQLRYNGFGQLTQEYQCHSGHVATASTPVVEYKYADGANRHIRKLSTTYPSGREIALSYGVAGSADDKLGRVHEIQDASNEDEVLARYTRRGISATMRIEYPNAGTSNPLEMTYIKQGSEPDGPAGDQYTGQDRFNRIIDIRWLRSGTTTHVDRIQYGFDRAGNRLWRKNVVAAENWDELYAYDGLYQLPERQRGTLNSGHTGITGTPAEEEDFDYDPAGNWEQFVYVQNGDTTMTQTRSHNKANEITAIDASSSLVAHDAAGNMIKFPKAGNWSAAQTATWDAWNRLVKIEEGSELVCEYAYDGFTRRVTKDFGVGPIGIVHFYYSDQWQVLEERVFTYTHASRTFVWGLRYIDDLICRDVGSSRLYATHDQWHVISTVGTNGEATERFAYRAFGETQVLAPDFTLRTSSLSGWETTYGAYRWDAESGLYAVRFRHLHPGLGRWLSRDPLGEYAGANLFSMVANQPINYADPFGLQVDSITNSIPQLSPQALQALGLITWAEYQRRMGWPQDIEPETEHYPIEIPRPDQTPLPKPEPKPKPISRRDPIIDPKKDEQPCCWDLHPDWPQCPPPNTKRALPTWQDALSDVLKRFPNKFPPGNPQGYAGTKPHVGKADQCEGDVYYLRVIFPGARTHDFTIICCYCCTENKAEGRSKSKPSQNCSVRHLDRQSGRK